MSWVAAQQKHIYFPIFQTDKHLLHDLVQAFNNYIKLKLINKDSTMQCNFQFHLSDTPVTINIMSTSLKLTQNVNPNGIYHQVQLERFCLQTLNKKIESINRRFTTNHYDDIMLAMDMQVMYDLRQAFVGLVIPGPDLVSLCIIQVIPLHILQRRQAPDKFSSQDSEEKLCHLNRRAMTPIFQGTMSNFMVCVHVCERERERD